MYYTTFESYDKIVAGASYFVISVVLVNGHTITSSAMPMGKNHTDIMDMIREAVAQKLPLEIWNREQSCSIIIPYDQISTVSINIQGATSKPNPVNRSG
jgi:hypothetical protein